MPSQEKITFSNLQPNISDALKASSPIKDAVVYKIADEVYHIKIESVEPGVEIAQNLSTIIDSMIKDSARLGCDLSVIVQGILIGAFRSRSVQWEAHKTIRLLAQEIMGSVFNYKGDIKKAVDGLLAGIVIIAKEHALNIEEAVLVVKEDILFSAKSISPEFADEIKGVLDA